MRSFHVVAAGGTAAPRNARERACGTARDRVTAAKLTALPGHASMCDYQSNCDYLIGGCSL